MKSYLIYLLSVSYFLLISVNAEYETLETLLFDYQIISKYDFDAISPGFPEEVGDGFFHNGTVQMRQLLKNKLGKVHPEWVADASLAFDTIWLSLELEIPDHTLEDGYAWTVYLQMIDWDNARIKNGLPLT